MQKIIIRVDKEGCLKIFTKAGSNWYRYSSKTKTMKIISKYEKDLMYKMPLFKETTELSHIDSIFKSEISLRVNSLKDLISSSIRNVRIYALTKFLIKIETAAQEAETLYKLEKVFKLLKNLEIALREYRRLEDVISEIYDKGVKEL